jgi:hypothetical protein
MKKKFTLLFLFTLSAALCVAQNVPNGGFESWTDGEPDDWTTSNTPGFTSVSQEEPGYSGTYALKMQSVEKDKDNVIPNLVANGGGDHRGFPVSEKFTLLNFYYKFDGGTHDKLVVFVSLKDSELKSIGSGALEIEDDVDTFTKSVMPITYAPGSTPAYCSIEFGIGDKLGSGQPSLDSWFIVDDIVLSSPTGVQNLEINRNSLKVFPLPASEMLNLTINSEKEINSLNLNLFDLSGKRINAYQFNDIMPGNTNKTIDVSELNDGVYVLRSAESDFITKIIVQH